MGFSFFNEMVPIILSINTFGLREMAHQKAMQLQALQNIFTPLQFLHILVCCILFYSIKSVLSLSIWVMSRSAYRQLPRK